MSTKRTPLARPMHHPISDTALRAFRHMRRLERQCSCSPRDWDGEYWKHEQCKACAEWWEQHSVLHDELRPWQWPAVENPATRNPCPAASPATERYKPNLEAQARWRALAAACAVVGSAAT